MIKRKIWVTFQRKGIHLYPAAATDPKLEDVEYLGNPHRHLFKFKVWLEVAHNDRDIEFHQFLNWCEELYDNTLALDHKSCEMMAEELIEEITKKYSSRWIQVEVSEDGECGAILEQGRYEIFKETNDKKKLLTGKNTEIKIYDRYGK